MMILNILIPIIWAGGLLSLGQIVIPGGKTRINFENVFPLTAFLGVIIFAIGLIGLLTPILFYILTILLLIVFIAKFVPLMSQFAAFINNHPLPSLIIILISVWLSLAALSYPVGPDALYFHLGLPKFYAKTGSVAFIPGNIFSASPRAMEMVSTAFFSMGLERSPQFFILLIAIILVITVWRKAEEICGSGKAAALILVSASIFSTQLVDSKNDILLAGAAFFAILQFIEFRQNNYFKNLIFAGIGAGLAAGIKATGLAILGTLFLILFIDFIMGRIRLLHIATFLSLFIVFAFPWYVYSWIAAGNPMYPFYDKYFHSTYWAPAFDIFNKSIAAKISENSMANFIISPFNLIFDPESFRGRIGFAIILFPLLILFLKKIPTVIRWFISIALIYYCFWYIGFPLARYLLPILPLLAIAGSYFIKKAIEARGIVKYLVMSSLLFAVIIPIPTILSQTSSRVVSVIRNIDRDQFLDRFKTFDPNSPHSGEMIDQFGYIKCWRAIENFSSQDDRIGILSSFWTRADGYYLNRNYVYLNPSEQRAYDFTSIKSSPEASQTLSNLGISFVVIDNLVLEEFSTDSPWFNSPNFQTFFRGVESLNDYLKTTAAPVYTDNRFSVYKIKILPSK